MNSFNHYSFGAVGTWMYENIAGIRAAEPGFKKVILHPRLGGGLTFARGEYKSIHGMIKSHWRIEGDALNWDISIPPNVTAEAFIPAGSGSSITESDSPLEQAPDVKFLRQTADAVVVELQSGEYRFKVTAKT
jgi:alpha-L-rhamnosidase